MRRRAVTLRRKHLTQDDHRQIDALHAELLRVRRPARPGQHGERALHRYVAEFASAPVRGFVPLLAQRRVRQEPRDL